MEDWQFLSFARLKKKLAIRPASQPHPPSNFKRNGPDTACFSGKFLPDLLRQLWNNRNELIQCRECPITVDLRDKHNTEQTMQYVEVFTYPHQSEEVSQTKMQKIADI